MTASSDDASSPVPASARRLEEALGSKTACVAVMGLGYVGLPLVRSLISAGYQVLGFDVDQRKIDRLKAGESYIAHIPGEWISERIEQGKFAPTSDPKRLGEADALLICVPTPLTETRDPDLTYVVNTAEQIAASLRPNQLIVLESTTYPGTTRDVVRPILEQSGLVSGRDFFLAFSPEREDPGHPDHTASRIPKVVGGCDPASLRLATLLYEGVAPQIVPVSTAEVAEACKLLENVYRAVNIALVNELKMIFDRLGVDVWEVIDAAKTKPFGFQAFYPGPGLGGHCIPIDPFYLTWLARRAGLFTRFIELAGEVNTQMPTYVVQKLVSALNAQRKPLNGSRVCVLGVAYKKDVDDPRESPAFEIIEQLLSGGAVISFSDPHVPKLPKMRRFHTPELTSEPLTAEFLQGIDAVVIVTDHSAVDYDHVVRHAPLVVDSRNATKHVKQGREKIVRA